jgi:outer membrane protein assembly factor BamB
VGTVRIRGRGFVEGNGSQYTIDGGTITDADGSSGPNVFFCCVHGGDGVDFTLPAHAAGNFTATTVGGTSAPLAASFIHPAAGDLRDVGFAAGNLWVATASGQLRRVSQTTGETLANWPIPGGGASGTGLQVLPSGMTLAGVAIPAGHLLVSSWNFNPDRIMAINPADGTVTATLNLTQNIDPVAVQYDPSGGGHLYVLDTSPDEVVEIDPATGARIRAFATTLPAGTQDAGGLAFHPTTGNLWVGTSINTPLVAELNPTTGALIRTVDLAPFGLGSDISGLAFNAAARLLVSSYRTGVVHVLDLAAPPVDLPPTLTAITAVARDGTAHLPAVASANVAQTIELVGTNFTMSTPFIFPTRDAAGNEGTVTTTPTAVSADRTRAQVVVPDRLRRER